MYHNNLWNFIVLIASIQDCAIVMAQKEVCGLFPREFFSLRRNVGKIERLPFYFRWPKQGHFQVNLTFVTELEKIPVGWCGPVCCSAWWQKEFQAENLRPGCQALGDATRDQALVAWRSYAGRRIAFQSLLFFFFFFFKFFSIPGECTMSLVQFGKLVIFFFLKLVQIVQILGCL